jgi:4-amino-4-deoxy-L-arabinose transferase-like glycosyltransferase
MSYAYSQKHNIIGIKQNVIDHRILIGLVLITLIAGFLRLYRLGDHSLWFDEAFSVKNANQVLMGFQSDPWDPFAFTETERLPPLYFLLLAPLYNISSNEWVLRFLSAIFGILSVPLIYVMCAQLANQKVGMVAALLLASSPFHIYYSRELRPYSLFLFFTLLAYSLFHLALQERKIIYFFGFIASVTLGIYTHTYMIFVLFILDLYFISNWKTNRLVVNKWLLSHLIIGILCIPALYLIIYHFGIGNIDLADSPPGLQSIAGTFYLFSFGRQFFPTLPNLPLIILQSLICGFGLFLGVWSLWKARVSKYGHQALTFILSGIMIYILIWLISISIKPLFDETRVNYLIFLLPVFIFIIALGFSYLTNLKLKIAVVSTALIISLATNFPYFFQWDQVGKGNFRAAAAYVRLKLEENDVVFHTSYGSALPFNYYFNWRIQQILLKSPDDLDTSQLDHFWLVVFKTTEGVQFSKNLLSENDINSLPQDDTSSVCLDAYSNSKYKIVDYKVFPGKNELIICSYQREVSYLIDQLQLDYPKKGPKTHERYDSNFALTQ